LSDGIINQCLNEPGARDVAEDCLRRFLRGDSIGSAIRNARLTLLKEGNPLGLVYIPFALSGLSVVDETAAK